MSDIKIIEIYFDKTIWANIINDRCWNLGYNLSLYDFSPCIIWLALVERSTNNGIHVNVSHNAYIIERIVSVFDLDIVVQKKNKTKQQQKTKTTTTTKSKVVKRGLYSHRQRYSPSKCCGLTKRSVEVSGGQKGGIDGSIFLTPCRRNHKRTLPDASPG